MLNIIVNEVEKKQKKLLERLEQEEKINGGYENWYKQLKAFRNSLAPYIRHRFWEKGFHSKITVVSSGDIIDHHIISYFAPLDYSCIGWNGKKGRPVSKLSVCGNT